MNKYIITALIIFNVVVATLLGYYINLSSNSSYYELICKRTAINAAKNIEDLIQKNNLTEIDDQFTIICELLPMSQNFLSIAGNIQKFKYRNNFIIIKKENL